MTLRGVSLLLPVFLIVVISALMLYFTGLIPAFGEWYSYDQTFRLQTEAFLRGELALQPVPYAHAPDTSWGNGLHQVWWLGVPLLKLPFEVIAKLFGTFGFPDRLHFLLLYIVVIIILLKSLTLNITADTLRKERSKKWMQNIPVLIFLLLNPTLITMMRARFQPYEEVIAYGYLWAFLIFALLLIFINNRQGHLYFLICFLAGFSPNIRPTIGAYGFVTFLMAFYFAQNRPVRFCLVGFLLFLIGPVFILVTNFFRFGSPSEFGHSLALTGVPMIDYALRFDNPLKWPPFKDVALELLSALFFVDLEGFYANGLLWQTNVPRMREFNFKPFDFVTLVLLVLSWIVVAIVWVRRSKEYLYSKSEKDKIIWGGVWSLCSFIILFYYYTRYPAIAARHLVDFGPAAAMGGVILYLSIINFIRCRFPEKLSFRINAAVSAAFVGWTLFSISQTMIVPMYKDLGEIERTNVASAEIARKKLVQMRQTKGPSLPSSYSCGDRETMFGIPYNNIGWKTSTDCGVFWVTSHFLENPTCLAIYVDPVKTADERLTGYSDSEIKVKVGLDYLHRTSELKVGNGKIINYCAEKDSRKRNRPELVSIAWINFSKHPGISGGKHLNPSLPLPPIKLLSLEKVR